MLSVLRVVVGMSLLFQVAFSKKVRTTVENEEQRFNLSGFLNG